MLFSICSTQLLLLLLLSLPTIVISSRYLSTGMTMHAISHEYCLGVKTVQVIIESTCSVLWDVLVPLYMNPNKTEDDWIEIARKFYERTDFPNVIGALDGKHIRIVQPNGTGSMYFNYKNFFFFCSYGLG